MIYADTDTCKWHVNNLHINNDLNVAVFHMPYPYTSSFATDINQALEQYDRIAILISELHLDSVAHCQKYQHPKIQYFTCGFVKGVDTNYKYTIAKIHAVTDGANVDWDVFGGISLSSGVGAAGGQFVVSIASGNIQIAVTPSSSNSTTWTTKYTTI